MQNNFLRFLSLAPIKNEKDKKNQAVSNNLKASVALDPDSDTHSSAATASGKDMYETEKCGLDIKWGENNGGNTVGYGGGLKQLDMDDNKRSLLQFQSYGDQIANAIHGNPKLKLDVPNANSFRGSPPHLRRNWKLENRFAQKHNHSVNTVDGSENDDSQRPITVDSSFNSNITQSPIDVSKTGSNAHSDEDDEYYIKQPNDNNSTQSATLPRKLSSTGLNTQRSNNGSTTTHYTSDFRFRGDQLIAPAASTARSASDMNILMLLGLVVGLILSKALQYLELYFCWFENQILMLRNALTGNRSLIDLFSANHKAVSTNRTGLLMFPAIITVNLFYLIVVGIHYTIRFLLSQAPNHFVEFIQKLYGG